MIQETIHCSCLPEKAGPYSAAVRAGDFIFVSGQLPIDCDGKITAETIEEQTRACLNNMNSVLRETGIDISYILQLNIYLKDLDDLACVNDILAEYFNEPYPARTTVQVNRLTDDAKIEISGFAIDTRALEVLCSSEGRCDGTICELE